MVIVGARGLALAAGAAADKLDDTFVCAAARLQKPAAKRKIICFIINLSPPLAYQSPCAPGLKS